MKKQNLSEEDLDKLLDNLSQSAHGPSKAFSAEESYNRLQERFPVKKAKRFHLLRYAAVASIVLIVALSAYLFIGLGNPEIIVVATTDQIEEITLPDGTHVTLSRYSSLTYPEKFTDEVREVTLSGEGYFDVHKDKKHPFIVQAQDVRVKVLGTRFNVQSYSDDPYIKTTLLEGSVSVSNIHNTESIILQPDESAIFDKKTAGLAKEKNEYSEDEAAWRNGHLIFNNITLAEIARDLSNHYNIKIEITDNTLKAYKLTARFTHNENVEEILTLLQTAGNFKWSRSADSIIIKPL